MSSGDSISNPLVFLDKIARSYPYGIARNAIKQPEASVGLASFDCAVLLAGQSGSLADAERTLLEGIITKGLKLSSDRCLVRGVDSFGVAGDSLAGMVADLRSRVVLVLGGSNAPGTRVDVGSVPVLFSYSLARIAAEAAIKREFWGHLQAILPVLA